jgi:hypothetical protein
MVDPFCCGQVSPTKPARNCPRDAMGVPDARGLRDADRYRSLRGNLNHRGDSDRVDRRTSRSGSSAGRRCRNCRHFSPVRIPSSGVRESWRPIFRAVLEAENAKLTDCRVLACPFAAGRHIPAVHIGNACGRENETAVAENIRSGRSRSGNGFESKAWQRPGAVLTSQPSSRLRAQILDR